MRRRTMRIAAGAVIAMMAVGGAVSGALAQATSAPHKDVVFTSR